MKKLLRKVKHKQFLRAYVSDLRWESLNIMIVASRTEWNEEIIKVLNNNALLVRKYERRMRWVKF